MHDKIKAIIPKEMRKEECTCFLSAPCGNCESEGDYDIGQRDGYNLALREVRAKIPEIVALVEEEVRKCVPEKMVSLENDYYLGRNDTVEVINTALEALFSNKK